MNADFAMFTVEGDRAVAATVREARSLEPEERKEFVRKAACVVGREHPAVFDTMVRERIAAELGDPAITYWTIAKLLAAAAGVSAKRPRQDFASGLSLRE